MPSPEPLTWKARADFDAAVAAGDAARIADLFAPDAFVIAATGDTLPARDAIALYLAQGGRDPGTVRFSWGREGPFQQCVGGAREHLTYTASVTRADGSSSSVSGALSVYWRSDSTGAVRVAWIAFPKREVRRKLTRSECPSVDAIVWRSWRWAVGVSPMPGLGRGMRSSMESILRERGWTDKECVCAAPAFGVRPTPISDWKAVVPPGLVTVQRHFKTHLGAAFAAGRTPHGTTVGAKIFPNRDYAHTRFWFSAAFVEGMVVYDRWPFQIGFGPVLQISHLRMRDSLVPYSTGGLPSFSDTAWTATSLGVAGDVRYNMLVGSRTFVTLDAQVRPMTAAKSPATPRFPAASLGQWDAVFGVGFGVIW